MATADLWADITLILSKATEIWKLIGQLGRDIGLTIADVLNKILPSIGLGAFGNITNPINGSLTATVILIILLEMVRKGGDTFLGIAKTTWNTVLKLLIIILVVSAIPNIL